MKVEYSRPGSMFIRMDSADIAELSLPEGFVMARRGLNGSWSKTMVLRDKLLTVPKVYVDPGADVIVALPPIRNQDFEVSFSWAAIEAPLEQRRYYFGEDGGISLIARAAISSSDVLQ